MNLEQQGTRTRIHILKGTGRNCTCGDCPVLYGGECWTTPENDFLDALGARVAKATVNGRVVSKNDMHKALETIRSPVKKYLHISEEIYNENYYALLPLLYIISNGLIDDQKRQYDRRDARSYWQRARMFALREYRSRIAVKAA
jgi:hypothetical protein